MSLKKHKQKTIFTVESLYIKIKTVLDLARDKAYRFVNFVMVEAYWNIGKIIVEEEQKGQRRAKYGTYLLQNLSERLTKDYGKGFDDRNLRNMRSFYLIFPIWDAVRTELSWTHYRLLFKVEKTQAQQFYLKEAIEGNWSTRQLSRQINSFYYERLLASKKELPIKKEAESTGKKLKDNPQDFIKDPYVLEFLGLQENKKYLESELETAIIDKLQTFLLELGKGFSFVARQQRISTETKYFYIDLVFFNYILNCFLLIDLKINELTHQDIGQMDMYIRLYEDKIKPKGVNPTIGLILCTEKDTTIVKYSVLNENKRLFASKYKVYLPTERELKEEITKDRGMIEGEKREIKE